MSNLLTVLEFAALAGVSRASVFAMLTRGLPSVKLPGMGRRILRAEAEAWLMAGGPRKPRSVRSSRAA